jgi:prepilin-type N-terminal cleavage/methylation domain-containing protein
MQMMSKVILGSNSRLKRPQGVASNAPAEGISAEARHTEHPDLFADGSCQVTRVPHNGGFSLIELIIALSITLLMSLMVFQLFQQNEKTFRDQGLILAMQQNTRVVLSEIADEIRTAGQGVPIYSTTFDIDEQEAGAVILDGSDATHLRMRAGTSGIDSDVISSVPLTFTIGNSTTVTLTNIDEFYEELGGLPNPGRFVYVWGPCAAVRWCWIRAEVTAVAPGANTITLTPRQAMADTVQFTGPPVVSLEEVLSIYFDAGSVRRASSTNMASQTAPVWGAAAELGQSFTGLRFKYYSATNSELVPPFPTLAARLAISRIDVQVVSTTSAPLSTGTQMAFALSAKVLPRNVRIR